MVALIAIVSSSITGTSGPGGPGSPGGTEGAKDRMERQIQQIDLHNVYVGFFAFGTEHNDNFPSTKNSRGTMSSDTTHEVFATLVDYGSVVPQQLVSPNEMDTDVVLGSPNSFGVNNASYALNDYDADNWLRYRQWNTSGGSRSVILSDRWYVDRVVPDYHSINGEWWHVLMGDGSTQIARNTPMKPGSNDDLFKRDSSAGEYDALMVHD